jgi:DNA-binding transcriptional LysR family regulator
MPGGYPAGLEVRPLVSEPLSLACPPGHRLASRRRIRLGELAGERFVDFPSGWGTRLSVDQLFAKHGLDREVGVEIADIVVVSELVRAGFGLAFLSPSLLGTARDVRLIPVVPSPQFVVSLIRPADRPLSAAARAFWELTTNWYPGT